MSIHGWPPWRKRTPVSTRSPRKTRAPWRLEALEERIAPTANLYLDFGGGFAGGTLNVNLGTLRSNLPGGLQGPNLTGAFFGGAADADDVTLTRMSNFVNFDYNGDAATNAQDAVDLQAAVVSLVTRYYAPFDVSVIVASAASVADIQASLNVPGGNHSYSFVVGGTLSAGSIPGGLFGISNGTDIDDPNNNDNTEITFVNNIFGFGYNNATADTALAYTAAHEGAHDFGLRHTYNATANNDRLMADSDMISQFAGLANETNLNMVTRFNLVLGDGNTNRTVFRNSYDKFAGDPNVGLKPGGPAYVTGTGAHDIITITNLGGGTAQVTVQAFSDAAHTTVITVPGPLTNSSTYNISTANGILIDAGDRNDIINIDGTLGVPVTLRGMAGQDSVSVNAGGNHVTYTPAPSAPIGFDGLVSRGGVLSVGTTAITFSEFETTGAVTVTNLGNMTINGSAGVDSFNITDFSTTQVVVSGTINGVPMVPVIVPDTDNLQVNGLGDSDSFTVTSLGMAATLGIDGGTGTNTATVSSTVISNAGGDGLSASNFSTFGVSNSSFNNNGGDGIQGANVGTTLFTNVTATGNDPGVFLDGFATFTDMGGDYSGNLFQGIRLLNGGTVALTNTAASNNGGSGIDLDSVGATTLTNVSADGNGGHGLRFVDSFFSDFTATDSDLDGNDLDGIHLDDVLNVDISNTTANANGGDGLDAFFTEKVTLDLASSFSNNTGGHGVKLNDTGIIAISGITASGNSLDGLNILDGDFGITIAGSTFNTNGGNGVEVNGSAGVTMTNSTATGNAVPAVFWHDSKGIGVFTNVNAPQLRVESVTGNGGAADGLHVDNLGNGSGLVGVINSTFSNNTGDGIDLDSVGATTLTNVSADGNGGHGLRFVDSFFSDFTATDSDLDGNDLDGIHLDDVLNVDISNTTANANGGDGLDAFFTEKVTLDSASSFSNNTGGHGVKLNDTGIISISGITASGNSLDGLNILDGDFGITIAGSTFDGNGDDGVDIVDSAAVEAGTSTAHDNGDHGITIVNGTTATLTSVSANSNGFNGLNIVGGTTVDITGGTFNANTVGGILLRNISVSATLTSVTASGNVGEDGLDIDPSGDISIASSTFNNNAAHGIDLDDVGDVSLTNVTATGNASDGLSAFNVGDVSVLSSTFSSNGSDGLEFTDFNNLVFNATASNNADDGLEAIDGSKATVTGTFSGNGGSGVSVNDVDLILSAVVFTANTVGAEALNGSTVDLKPGVVFNGGQIGLRVDGPTSLIVGLTLGTTQFAGQSVYFVQLGNSAMKGPKLIDGTKASYNGTVGQFLTNAQYAAVMAKLYHFPNDFNLGLIIPRFGGVFVAGGSLFAIGSPGNDTFQIQPGTTNARIRVTINSIYQGEFAVTNPRIYVFGLGGYNQILYGGGLVYTAETYFDRGTIYYTGVPGNPSIQVGTGTPTGPFGLFGPFKYKPGVTTKSLPLML